MKLEPLQRVASITKSPPKKRVKEVESNKNSDTKDIIISNLETRNANLVEATERKQEMINKQATIIGGLKVDLEEAILALAVRDATITELRLPEAATDVNRNIGTTPNEEDIPPLEGRTRPDLQPTWLSLQEEDLQPQMKCSWPMKGDGKIWSHIRRR